MKSSANIIIYFNGDVININEGVTFICKRPAYFFIPYTMSFAELQDGFC